MRTPEQENVLNASYEVIKFLERKYCLPANAFEIQICLKASINTKSATTMSARELCVKLPNGYS